MDSKQKKKKRFDQLYDISADQLFRYAFYLTHNKEAAEDIVQQVFIKAWEKLDNIREGEELPYLMKSIKNLYINSFRKAQSKSNIESSLTQVRVENSTPLYELEVKEFHIKLNSTLQQMNETQREVFMMSRVEGMKYNEIAKAIGISQKAVEKRMSLALKFLRERISSVKW